MDPTTLPYFTIVKLCQLPVEDEPKLFMNIRSRLQSLIVGLILTIHFHLRILSDLIHATWSFPFYSDKTTQEGVTNHGSGNEEDRKDLLPPREHLSVSVGGACWAVCRWSFGP